MTDLDRPPQRTGAGPRSQGHRHHQPEPDSPGAGRSPAGIRPGQRRLQPSRAARTCSSRRHARPAALVPRAPKVCRCGATAKPGDSRCATCIRAHHALHNARRPTPASKGYDSQWRRTSQQYRATHPTCEHDGCTTPSAHVHHLDGKGPRGPHGHDPANLQALCHHHHSVVTAAEQPAGFNA